MWIDHLTSFYARVDTLGMNTHTVTDEVQTRRDAATVAFKDKAHTYYHRINGESAPCHMCGNIAKGQKGFAL